MNVIRYEPVFGPQELFCNCMNDVVCVSKDDETGEMFQYTSVVIAVRDLVRYNGSSDFTVAMRRIIRTPVWTKADYDAGKLPEVGAKIDGGTVVFVNSFNIVVELDSGAVIVSSHKTFLAVHKPIETDAERQQRLREEWCSKALDSAGILSEMKRYDLKRLGEYIGSIHDALLSGELPMPKKEDE